MELIPHYALVAHSFLIPTYGAVYLALLVAASLVTFPAARRGVLIPTCVGLVVSSLSVLLIREGLVRYWF
jgi:hypothetical protein